MSIKLTLKMDMSSEYLNSKDMSKTYDLRKPPEATDLLSKISGVLKSLGRDNLVEIGLDFCSDNRFAGTESKFYQELIALLLLQLTFFAQEYRKAKRGDATASAQPENQFRQSLILKLAPVPVKTPV